MLLIPRQAPTSIKDFLNYSQLQYGVKEGEFSLGQALTGYWLKVDSLVFLKQNTILKNRNFLYLNLLKILSPPKITTIHNLF